ncbi:MAG TPA: acetate uptake transporter [Methanomassiliicoccales archaeon]
MAQITANLSKTANPAPLGLMGFGMTTILLNLHNAGFFALGSMILAMGIFYGGIAQVVAGVMEWKKGNTFGMMAFTSYGMFWISLVALIVMPQMGIGTETGSSAMAAFLFMWAIFSGVMLIGTLKTNKVMIFVFGSLTLLLVLLGLGNGLNNPDIKMIAGYEGIICGASALYLAAAEILNEVYGRAILPIFSTSKQEKILENVVAETSE